MVLQIRMDEQRNEVWEAGTQANTTQVHSKQQNKIKRKAKRKKTNFTFVIHF